MIDFHASKLLQAANGILLMDVSFQLEQGKVLAIYGSSGAGKTTLLRILAGLMESDKSSIHVDGVCWEDTTRGNYIPAHKRSVGFVFQDFALFPNLTIYENLQYALQKGEDKNTIEEVIEMIELHSFRNCKPQHLSGGQKQRVALARAIIRKPKILLLDEPLSALDDAMRFKLQDYILKIHRHFKFTTLLVSHHLPEIFKLADKVIFLEAGKIKKEGSPSEVFSENKISGKFKVTGEIISIEASDMIYIISILSGNNIVKVIATDEEIKDLEIGTKVLISSKAFNPIIQKIG